ncbi:MAG: thiaminase II [Rhodospirillales bacterium 20-64-7]|nr:MAG: thiaminase II [Rhodospirillales bacterium 20-64-7]
MQLFERLRAGAPGPWARYIGHPFVRALGDGTLPREKFQRFLIQDYLFLVQYARAWMLLAYKLDEPAEMREAMATATALLETELPLHIGYCAGWGIVEAELAAAPASLECIAYTRYVLEVGHAGDALELMAALAPCIAGYAEIGAALAPGLAPDNPYRDWVAAYTGADYLGSVTAALALMQRLAERAGAEARFEKLQRIFTQATACEAAFWETGWR